MLLGKPIFQGTSTFNQLERILQHIPTPSQSDIASIESHYGPSVLERASSGYTSIRLVNFTITLIAILYRHKKSFEHFIPNASDEALDLLRRLLHFNPDKRITAEDGLRHSFVISYVLLFLIYAI